MRNFSLEAMDPDSDAFSSAGGQELVATLRQRSKDDAAMYQDIVGCAIEIDTIQRQVVTAQQLLSAAQQQVDAVQENLVVAKHLQAVLESKGVFEQVISSAGGRFSSTKQNFASPSSGRIERLETSPIYVPIQCLSQSLSRYNINIIYNCHRDCVLPIL